MTNGDSRPGSRKGGPPDQGARTRYISCTPLLGSDDQVGVWMVVMVENELVTGSLASRQAALNRYNNEIPPTPSEYQRESHIGSDTDEGGGAAGGVFESRKGASGRSPSGQQVREERRRGKVDGEGRRLYADFMKNTAGGGKTSVDGGMTEQENGGAAGIRQLDDGETDRYVNGEGRVEQVTSP